MVNANDILKLSICRDSSGSDDLLTLDLHVGPKRTRVQNGRIIAETERHMMTTTAKGVRLDTGVKHVWSGTLAELCEDLLRLQHHDAIVESLESRKRDGEQGGS